MDRTRTRHTAFEDGHKELVRDQYSGTKGALLTLSGWLSGHEPMAASFFRRGLVDVRNARRVLDVGCGMGRFLTRAIRHAPPDARFVGLDLSLPMLKRTRRRLNDRRVSYVLGDVTRLPFRSATFDRIICAWVLEHLPAPEEGLAELSRVLTPDGKLYVFVTEATLPGILSGKLWRCFPQDRTEFLRRCRSVGLACNRELWWTRAHRLLGLGGICLELTHASPGKQPC